MKKRIILCSIFILSLIILISGVNIITHAVNGENSYKKIAWEALDKDTKQYYSRSWKNAEVEDVTMENDLGILSLDKPNRVINIKGKEVKAVRFDTGNKLLGDVIVYIDVKTKKAIGKAPFM